MAVMAKGRKPQLRQVLSLNMNKKPSRQNPAPVEFDVSIPQMPEWLDKTGKEKWVALTTGLKPMAILSPVDADILAAYCSLYSQMVRCVIKLNKSGGFTKSANGGPEKTDPAVDQLTVISNRLAGLGKNLGLNPLARSKLVSDPTLQEKDWLDNICKEKE